MGGQEHQAPSTDAPIIHSTSRPTPTAWRQPGSARPAPRPGARRARDLPYQTHWHHERASGSLTPSPRCTASRLPTVLPLAATSTRVCADCSCPWSCGRQGCRSQALLSRHHLRRTLHRPSQPGPAESASGSASTDEPLATGRKGPGGKYTADPKSGFQLPDFVYGGNAISFMAPDPDRPDPKRLHPARPHRSAVRSPAPPRALAGIGVAALFDGVSWEDSAWTAAARSTDRHLSGRHDRGHGHGGRLHAQAVHRRKSPGLSRPSGSGWRAGFGTTRACRARASRRAS